MRLAAMMMCGVMASSAAANDSSAELAVGGLTFVKNSNVEMRSEDLFISSAEIRIRYKFFNISQKDVVVLVAFPMPDVTIEDPGTNISLPTENSENLLDFSTIADGRPIKARVEQRAFAKGEDQTARLRGLGVPLAPHVMSTNAVLDTLPRAAWPELIALGIADIEEYDNDNKGMKEHLTARWTLKTTYYWEQTFPAGREIVVEHRYKPSVGLSAGTPLGGRTAEDAETLKDYKRRYCMDDAFLRAVERAPKAPDTTYAPFTEERIAYVLKTGANWAGPIKDFRLVVDKGDARNLVSFCAEGVKKIGPTQFEVRKTDFIPKEDFFVLILTPYPQR